MMKKLIIIPLLVVGLIACQANPIEEAVQNKTDEEVVTDNFDNNEVELVDVQLYDEMISHYARFTEMTLEEAKNSEQEHVKIGAYELFHNSYVFKGISTAYHDINDDGVEELLVALRTASDYYALIDLFTIVDGEVISLFTDEISASIGYKRSGLSLLENGNLIYTTASGRGDKFGTIYELNEKDMQYVETYEVSLEAGDFSVIEKELEKTFDISTLDWKAVEKDQEKTVYDNFIKRDFSALEGTWQNGYDNEASVVTIEGNKLFYEDGSYVNVEFTREYSDEQSSVFDLRDENGFGALLYFYPKHSEIDFDGVFVPSDATQDRFFVTQTDPPDEKGIHYKISNVKD